MGRGSAALWRPRTKTGGTMLEVLLSPVLLSHLPLPLPVSQFSRRRAPKSLVGTWTHTWTRTTHSSSKGRCQRVHTASTTLVRRYPPLPLATQRSLIKSLAHGLQWLLRGPMRRRRRKVEVTDWGAPKTLRHGRFRFELTNTTKLLGNNVRTEHRYSDIHLGTVIPPTLDPSVGRQGSVSPVPSRQRCGHGYTTAGSVAGRRGRKGDG